MIKLPASIIEPSVLAKAVDMPENKMELEIVNTAIEKSSLTLVMTVRLNFAMPPSIESRIKDKLLATYDQIADVRFNYVYISDEPVKTNSPGKPEPESWRSYQNGRKKVGKVAGGEVILGKPITREPIAISEVYEEIGKGERSVEGEIFMVDANPLRGRDSTIFKVLISDDERALCAKFFADNSAVKQISGQLKKGIRVRVLGKMEYDSFESAFIFKTKAVNKVEAHKKLDEYPGQKRIELHAHTKMSASDGFNEISDLVTTAAEWGQPAVAITDHGVVHAFPKAMQTAQSMAKQGKAIKVLYGVEGYLFDDSNAINPDGTIAYERGGTNHIIIFAKNQAGIRDLYELVSVSHIDYFYKRPRLPRSIIAKFKDNLVIGSACEAGEIYQAVYKGIPWDELMEMAKFYDYMEIQPLGNNRFMIEKGMVADEQALIDINLKILELADAVGIPCVATTDSHYPTELAAIYRNIVMATHGFQEPDSNSLYLRTTEEMLAEFAYLGERREEVVIENTHKIAEMIEDGISPISPEKCPPVLENADERLRESCLAKAHSIYGDPLPPAISDRLYVEMDSIIENGYAVMYIAAQMLVQKSMSDGFLVGSRGSVGSSFVATMAGVTEVNPLAPHYICPKCKHFEFSDEPEKYDVAFDMPDKTCPECGTTMNKDGLNIPFATFLGFEGNKEPDIDLNFAGEYQSTIHQYVYDVFGKRNSIYKAGTISGLQEKTAYGQVMKYVDENHLNLNKFDVERLIKGIAGVKKTTGQHPGGMVIVPEGREVYEFSPIQYPADKKGGAIKTLHFDYHSIEHNLLKLDLLGHTVPQMIRHLQLMTGVDPLTIPLGDPTTLSIFTSLDALGIKNPNYRYVHGTYGIPEFGTPATRVMLDDIKPTNVSMLIKISGFAHGTAVWENNIQDLLRDGRATIDEVISSRDDIMNYLIAKGVDNSDAFSIMEVVRKSKRDLNEREINIMKEHGVPDWYIWSCNTLQYLFPRAHAAAYVMMAIRMAWHKVYNPQAFYAAWFTSNVDNFNIEGIKDGIGTLEAIINEIEEQGNSASAKDKANLTVYEVAYEMFSRGYEFAMPALGASEAGNFSVVDGKVQIPFQGISGVGFQAAKSLADACENVEFRSLDDVRSYTKLTQANIEEMKKYGLFTDLPESAQMSIFDL